MSTIRDVLDRCAMERPDAWSEEVKARWIMAINAELYRDVVQRHELNAGERLPELPMEYPADQDMELVAGAPFDDLYDLYVFARVDLANREIDNYNTSATVYAQRADEWRKHYHRTHMPITPDVGGSCCGCTL